MRRGARAPWLLAALGLALAVALFFVAQPGSVVALALGAAPLPLLAAFAGTLAAAALRGGRLALLVGELGAGRATAVAAVAQLASGVLPLRLGDLAMVPLLRAAGVPGTARGLTVLVLARLLDLIAILTWAVAAAALVGGSPIAAALGLTALLAAIAAAAVAGTRALARVARPWRSRPGWRRRILAHALHVRTAIAQAARSPARALGSAACSLAIWGLIWWVTVALIRGMGLAWPPVRVLAGVIGAALGSSVPLNSVGTFGTQEAGWAAALAGVGVPARRALAAGFACHLWVLAFTTVVGAVAALYLTRVQPGRPRSTALATLRSILRSGRGA